MQKKLSSNTVLKEVALLLPFFTLFLVVSLSGFIPYLFAFKPTTWTHWNTIGHSLLGLFMLIPFLFYTIHHFKRTLVTRRYFVLLTGACLTVILLYLYGTGAHIAIIGQQESKEWIYQTHIYAGYFTFLLFIAHLLLFFLKKKAQTYKTQANIFNVIDKKIVLKAILGMASYVAILLVATFLYESLYENSPYATPQAGDSYEYSYGPEPFLPSQSKTQDDKFIAEDHIANSPKCGACHEDIFKQWSSSIHSQASSDPAYVKNVTLLESLKGISATRYCEGCHSPVALLTGALSPGGKHGGIKGTKPFHEGVGCMGCHGIDSAVHTKGVGSYSYDPNNGYLFPNSQSQVATAIHNFLIRINPNQHRDLMSKDILKSPKLCATCHEQFMDKSMNNWGWVKMQSEYTSWLSSPFSGQTEHNFNSNNLFTCTECHLPLVSGNDPSANTSGKIVSHHTLGGNSVIPWLHKDTEQLERVRKFLQSSRVVISIDTPYRDDSTQTRQFVDESIRSTSETPYFLYLGEKTELQVTVTNRLVGHHFPAGTTDLKQAWVYLKVNDANNKILYETGKIDENGFLDENSHVYKTTPVDRNGKEVWKHNLFEMVGDTYKKLIPPNKSDVVKFTFDIPYWAQGPITVTTALKFRKFNQRYAKWALDMENPKIPVIEMSRDSLSIPIRKKPLIE